jgi:hypothetical protein
VDREKPKSPVLLEFAGRDVSRYFRKSRRFEVERACKGNFVDIP